jgi:PPM family protein phosphatase
MQMKIPIIESYGLSDIGTVRPNNEDVIASLPSHNFFVVDDGMGGHKAGEIAAKEATSELISSVTDFLNQKNQKPFSQNQIITNISRAIEQANRKVFTLGQNNRDYKGMGTTLCCLLLHNQWITYAHVGDSRIYLFRQKKLIQLTQDHSLLAEISPSGLLSNEHPPHPFKNIITRAIGTNLTIEPSIKIDTYFCQDRFLMCTDGLSDYLSIEEMTNILEPISSIEEVVKKLIESAKNNGSRDNISGLLIEIKDFQ